MAAPKNLEELQVYSTEKYATEPFKRKRSENPDFDASKKSTKTNPKFIFNEIKDWTPNSRYLMINLFYNILGETPPRTNKGKLPSIDEAALETMRNPIAKKLIALRKMKKTLDSFLLVRRLVHPDNHFAGDPSPFGVKGVIKFAPYTFDGIERIFTKAGESIPINTDKQARNAFICPSATIEIDNIDPVNHSILEQL